MSSNKHAGRRTSYAKWTSAMAKLDNELEKERQAAAKDKKKEKSKEVKK